MEDKWAWRRNHHNNNHLLVIELRCDIVDPNRFQDRIHIGVGNPTLRSSLYPVLPARIVKILLKLVHEANVSLRIGLLEIQVDAVQLQT